ncbi:hypothetical protein [Suilimivivens sp.]|uniref:hypothetical protein n=1 Tax=Suilimivivens sp. TaxID=2981669 RepID=UPI003078F2D6
MQTISDYFNHGFIIGRMSLNEARQWKYWAVSVVAIAIHYAILGGQEALSYLQEKALELVRAVHAARSKNALPPKYTECGWFLHIYLEKNILSCYIEHRKRESQRSGLPRIL